MSNLVFIENNQAVVNSRKIAEDFKKQHKHVLQSIESIKAENLAVTNMFYETTYKAGTGKQYKEYLLNRDGFTLLAMGFTGKKALEFKLAYINAFNEMEKTLNKQLPQDFPSALRALADETEKRMLLESENNQQKQIIVELNPKASYYDVVLQTKDSISVSQIAKDYGKSAKWLNNLLHEYGIQFKQGGVWLLYQKHAEQGYTKSKTNTYSGRDGNQHSKMHTYWTQKGRLFIYNLLKNNNIFPLIEQNQDSKSA